MACLWIASKAYFASYKFLHIFCYVKIPIFKTSSNSLLHKLAFKFPGKIKHQFLGTFSYTPTVNIVINNLTDRNFSKSLNHLE